MSRRPLTGEHLPVHGTYLFEMSIGSLDLSSAGFCLRLEEGQKIISLSRNANKPSGFEPQRQRGDHKSGRQLTEWLQEAQMSRKGPTFL